MAAAKKNKMILQTVRLADRLLEDIQCRNLCPGDAYLTTQEASRYLGVAGASANRALQLLEKRKVIRRSQRCGAIILEPPKPGMLHIDTVYFLVHDQYYRTEGVGGDGILLGIQSELHTSAVSHYFLTPENDVQQVGKLIENVLAEETADALILVRTSYDVQQMVARSKLPAIVYGGVYQGIDGLTQVDRDHSTAVRLIAEYLQNRQRTRLVVLMRQLVLPGDHLVFDTLQKESSFLITLRFTPSAEEHIESVVHAMLSRSDPPHAFLCQTIRQAKCVEKIRQDLNIAVKDLDIIVLSTYMKPGETTPFPHIVLESTAELTGRRFGTLLLERVAGKPPICETIPVKLVVPKPY